MAYGRNTPHIPGAIDDPKYELNALRYNRQISRKTLARLDNFFDDVKKSISSAMETIIKAFKVLGKGIKHVGEALKNVPKGVAEATMSVCKTISEGGEYLFVKTGEPGESKKGRIKEILGDISSKMSALFDALKKHAGSKEKEFSKEAAVWAEAGRTYNFRGTLEKTEVVDLSSPESFRAMITRRKRADKGRRR